MKRRFNIGLEELQTLALLPDGAAYQTTWHSLTYRHHNSTDSHTELKDDDRTRVIFWGHLISFEFAETVNEFLKLLLNHRKLVPASRWYRRKRGFISCFWYSWQELQRKDWYLCVIGHRVCTLLHHWSLIVPRGHPHCQISTRNKEHSLVKNFFDSIKSRSETTHRGDRIWGKTFCREHGLFIPSVIKFGRFFWAQQGIETSLSESVPWACTKSAQVSPDEEIKRRLQEQRTNCYYWTQKPIRKRRVLEAAFPMQTVNEKDYAERFCPTIWHYFQREPSQGGS